MLQGYCLRLSSLVAARVSELAWVCLVASVRGWLVSVLKLATILDRLALLNGLFVLGALMT